MVGKDIKWKWTSPFGSELSLSAPPGNWLCGIKLNLNEETN